jgi:3D (Asp-Asp-Asp) domain-containing protein
MILTVTGYSSSYDETDDDPWTTAYNTPVRDGIVASNILPFGTKIKIPEIFGDKVFIVEDKMNPRYGENLDIWFPTKEEALSFGIHYNVLVEILE